MAATDTFSDTSIGMTTSAQHIFAITPSDGSDLAFVTRGINASADCTVKITTDGGETITAFQLHKGYNPIRVTKVFSTGTTLGGASIWGLY